MGFLDRFLEPVEKEETDGAAAPEAALPPKEKKKEKEAENGAGEKTEADAGFIANLYQQYHKTDGPSIFAVEEYLGTLPSEMTDQKKLETILRIFQVSKISVPELAADGKARIQMLEKVRDQMVSEKGQTVASAKEEIEKLKAMIAKLEAKNREEDAEKEAAVAAVNAEVKHVRSLVAFIEEKEN